MPTLTSEHSEHNIRSQSRPAASRPAAGVGTADSTCGRLAGLGHAEHGLEVRARDGRFRPHALAGANGIYRQYPIQRLFRDQHALSAHIGFSWDAQGAPWGLVALGGDFSSPTL